MQNRFEGIRIFDYLSSYAAWLLLKLSELFAHLEKYQTKLEQYGKEVTIY